MKSLCFTTALSCIYVLALIGLVNSQRQGNDPYPFTGKAVSPASPQLVKIGEEPRSFSLPGGTEAGTARPTGQNVQAIRAIRRPSTRDMMLSVMPSATNSSNRLHLQLKAEKATKATLEVYDISGARILDRTVMLSTEPVDYALNLTYIKAGVYYILAMIEGQQTVHKFIKQAA